MTCSMRFVNRITALFLLALLTAAGSSIGQDQSKSKASPSALAQESFEALQRGDIAKFASYFHPDELKRFQSFAIEVFDANESDKKAGKEPDKESA